jgi:Ser/Thr protein kinase RdoA (MazF antagonist)
VSWADTLATLTPEVVSRAAALWDTAPLERVGLSANVVYRVESGDYLRLTHSRLREEAFVATGVDWARHLAGRDATVSAPLESKGGYFIERVDDWLATLWTGIRGETLTDTMTGTQLEAWGEAAGRLHAASASYQPRAVSTSSGEVAPKQLFLREFWQNILPVVSRDPELLEAYRTLTPFLETLPDADAVICHGDYRPANALWDGSQVWVVDFDEPVLGWAEYDLARALARDNDGPFPNLRDHLETLKRGYERTRGSRLNVKRLKTFLQFQALLSLAWSLEDESWGWTYDLRRVALEGMTW